MTMRTSAPPRIAIVGGGIGGLAAAAFLHRQELPATVYEQAARLTEVGAGLVVAPNLARLLRRLGALDGLRERAVQLHTAWEFRRWADGTVLSSENLAQSCEKLYGEHTYTMHRADLLRVIQSAVPAESVQLGRKCVGLESSGGALRLRFADGEAAEADAVIGAGGIHFTVRNTVFGASPATYSGLCAFRALVPATQAPEFARRPAQTLWVGPGHHLVHYPVPAGERVNLVAFAPAGDYTVESWTATATVQEFLAEFEGYEELRIPRTTRLQSVSHGRAHLNHLPDGPEQRERDAAFTRQDPLVANGWIHAYDPDAALENTVAAHG